MTSAQTTEGRLRSQIYYQLHGEFFSLETANVEVDRLAKAIAAEINAKDAEIARLKPYAEAALHTLNCERMMAPAWMIDNREEADKLAAVDFELWQELRRRYAREFGG